eukprot:TRINITY_DN608_c0_g1_i2.p1 TRINITY_DN608_c0_g1~~TRINITY_DN608_c0_g1_i2.p1  ORF type:complete len:158 (+),score=34.08 TRINITY_DN608_c0_g1_i2:322-795(+)
MVLCNTVRQLEYLVVILLLVLCACVLPCSAFRNIFEDDVRRVAAVTLKIPNNCNIADYEGVHQYVHYELDRHKRFKVEVIAEGAPTATFRYEDGGTQETDLSSMGFHDIKYLLVGSRLSAEFDDEGVLLDVSAREQHLLHGNAIGGPSPPPHTQEIE